MIQALYEGKRVRHRYFGDDEYMYMYKDEIYTEDGYNMGSINDEFMEIRKGGFWENNWEVIEEDIIEKPVEVERNWNMFRKPYFWIALVISALLWWGILSLIF